MTTDNHSSRAQLRRRRVVVVFDAIETAERYAYQVEGIGSDRVLATFACHVHGLAGLEDVDFHNPAVIELEPDDASAADGDPRKESV